MAYEMTSIIEKCNKDEIGGIISIIDSYVNWSDDKKLKDLHAEWVSGQPIPDELARLLETEIRYIGSNDAAYVVRKLRGLEPAGVSIHEIIDDIADHLKIPMPKTQDIEYKLELLCKHIFKKYIDSLNKDELVAWARTLDVKADKLNEIIQLILANKKGIPEILTMTVGPAMFITIVRQVILAQLGNFIGNKAVAQVAEALLLRMPPVIFPILGGAFALWLAIDLIGPAMRKTIPVMLTLGVILLKDGPQQPDMLMLGDE